MNCPRGQFIQFTGEDDADLWPLCDGQDDAKCAKKCYVPRMGDPSSKADQDYWSQWIGRRMAFIKLMAEKIDLFIAPAEHLKRRFIEDGSLFESLKLVFARSFLEINKPPQPVAYLSLLFLHIEALRLRAKWSTQTMVLIEIAVRDGSVREANPSPLPTLGRTRPEGLNVRLSCGQHGLY